MKHKQMPVHIVNNISYEHVTVAFIFKKIDSCYRTAQSDIYFLGAKSIIYI